MNAKTADSKHSNILEYRDLVFGRETLASLLQIWRKKLGYFSMFAATPWTLALSVQDEQPGKQPFPTNGRPGGKAKPIARASNAQVKPSFLRTQSGYRLPHQKRGFDLATAFAGTDDCPGKPIPGGVYTPAAPYIDSGDTTGANNTVTRILGYYYYYNSAGPDHIYSFTLTGRGPGAKIEVTTSSGTYRPMIYVTEGLDRSFPGCPAGTGFTTFTVSQVWDSRWGTGSTASLNLRWVPLNTPLYLLIDSQLADGNGSGQYTVRLHNASIAPATIPSQTKFDFDGDGKADPSVYRAAEGKWYLRQSEGGFKTVSWGLATDKLVPGDFDADGKTDTAVWRPAEGNWYIVNSSDNTFRVQQWGLPGDMPAQADFDGDLRYDLAVFRPGEGNWYVMTSSGGLWISQFGTSDGIPVQVDYDGDGFTDRATYKNGLWNIARKDGPTRIVNWGLIGDIPVPADYSGDGIVEPAVFRPTEGNWYIAYWYGTQVIQWGQQGDIPVPADYDGNGSPNLAFYRNGAWHVFITGGGITITNWGLPGDVAVPAVNNP